MVDQNIGTVQQSQPEIAVGTVGLGSKGVQTTSLAADQATQVQQPTVTHAAKEV